MAGVEDHEDLLKVMSERWLGREKNAFCKGNISFGTLQVVSVKVILVTGSLPARWRSRANGCVPFVSCSPEIPPLYCIAFRLALMVFYYLLY